MDAGALVELCELAVVGGAWVAGLAGVITGMRAGTWLLVAYNVRRVVGWTSCGAALYGSEHLQVVHGKQAPHVWLQSLALSAGRQLPLLSSPSTPLPTNKGAFLVPQTPATDMTLYAVYAPYGALLTVHSCRPPCLCISLHLIATQH